MVRLFGETVDCCLKCQKPVDDAIFLAHTFDIQFYPCGCVLDQLLLERQFKVAQLQRQAGMPVTVPWMNNSVYQQAINSFLANPNSLPPTQPANQPTPANINSVIIEYELICRSCKHSNKEHSKLPGSTFEITCTACNEQWQDKYNYQFQLIKQPIIPPLKVTPMSNSKFETRLKHSYARLKPMHDEIKKEFFHNKNLDFYFFGDTVRLSITGDVVDTYRVKMPNYGEIRDDYLNHLVQQDLHNLKFTNIADGETENLIGRYEFESSFGVKIVELWSDRPTSTFWNCDQTTFNGATHGGGTYVLEKIMEYKEIALINRERINSTNVESVLLEGAALTVKHGWAMSNDSLQYLNAIIERNKPVDKSDELIMGFRTFRINIGQLVGAHNIYWPNEYLEVDCPAFIEHVRESEFSVNGNPTDNQGNQIHGCGIYVYKSPSETLHFYDDAKAAHAIALVVCGGVVWEGERGYRAQKVRIEKLWVWRGGPELRSGVYNPNGGVMVDVSRDDFMREIFTSGVEFDSTKSLV